ncbi:hypothetical protein F511_28013 [Dorcoceras hygrometricum]|uniref:Uncharacterized protein n=1 Tax=Dorcoceras hygrometricum TaxID=472368 RepID=A0A2Z7BQS1_9LAMI|nr:hypothetical protein F511_28013 [Dorcoceras hygrometricum]
MVAPCTAHTAHHRARQSSTVVGQRATLRAVARLTNLARTESPQHDDRNKFDHGGGGAAVEAAAVRFWEERGRPQAWRLGLCESDEEDHGVVASNVGDQPAETADGKKHWFDLSYEDLMAQMDAERPVVTPSDTDEEMETIVIGDQQLQTVDTADYFVDKWVEDTETEADELSADEAMSIEDILLKIPADVPLPSAGVEISNITMGKDIKIPGVDERSWYLANLPKIKPEDMGKKPLEEKDPVKGHPVKEQILLILADIECLVQLRENIIDDVDIFFNLFIFKKLASLKVEDISAKEELVLSWGEAESTRVALNRRMYILTKLSQFCTVFVQNSLLNGLSITDIRSFVSSIVFERTALRDVQRSSVSIASQNVQLAFSSVVEDEDNQMDIDQRLASPTTTADSSMNFIDNDILLGDDATPNQPSLPTVSNLSTYLDDFRTLLWQLLDTQSEDIKHIGDSHNDVLSWLTTLDKGLRDALLQQGEDLRKLIQNVRQDCRTLDDVQTLRFNEFRKGFLAHSAAVTADLMDFRKEFRALNAKVTSLDEQVAATRNDLLEFSAQAQETLNHITDQLSKLIAYINRGGNDKKGEVSSSRPQPPPDDQNRGSGNTGGGSGARTTDIVDKFSGSLSREGRGRGSGGSRSRGHSKKRYPSSGGGHFRRSFDDWPG